MFMTLTDLRKGIIKLIAKVNHHDPRVTVGLDADNRLYIQVSMFKEKTQGYYVYMHTIPNCELDNCLGGFDYLIDYIATQCNEGLKAHGF